MLLTFREWWRSLCGWRSLDEIDPLPVPKRYRAKADRVVCPLCSRDVAYSRTTGLTSSHKCSSIVQQVKVDP